MSDSLMDAHYWRLTWEQTQHHLTRTSRYHGRMAAYHRARSDRYARRAIVWSWIATTSAAGAILVTAADWLLF